MLLRLSLALIAAVLVPASASSQTTLQACDSQAGIEQLIQSEGSLSPDGCRSVSLTRVETDVAELCVLNLTTDDSDVLGSLADAALPTEWWLSCEDLDLE